MLICTIVFDSCELPLTNVASEYRRQSTEGFLFSIRYPVDAIEFQRRLLSLERPIKEVFSPWNHVNI